MNDLLTNGTEIKQRIILEINNAKEIIYLAMAFFTDKDIAMSLVEAKNRGVFVDVILSSNAQNETVKLILKGAKINVHSFETGDSRGIMHHKFCLIDNKISINGSYNYSLNASNNNVENIYVSDDIQIYSQFLSEFERLKYNIDNQLNVNEESTINFNKKETIIPKNKIDNFSQELQHLVYSAAQIDTSKYKEDGYKNSNDNKGSIEIYRCECNNIKEKIRTYATDESLGNMKNTLLTNISIAFESTKTNLEIEKQEQIDIEQRNNELEKKHINEKINKIKNEKKIIEIGNESTQEKGILQINKEIEKNKLEKKNLEQSFTVKKFWNIGSILVTIGLTIFIFYLSLFFGSAVYKVFFESNFIRTSLEAGINPGLPQLVDANATIKIYKTQGVLFGLIATLFFIIPVLLSNLKILGSEKKTLNRIFFIVGLFVFDILVSSMVAFNTDEIKNLLVGKESTLKIWQVFGLGEFWLIFIFGTFPLLLTHYLIDFLVNAYKKSKREIIDVEKNKKIQFLDEEMIELLHNKEILLKLIGDKDELLIEYDNDLLILEKDLNNKLIKIELFFAETHRQINTIYNDFKARIISGRIFTDIILDSVISSYKSGFIEYLPKYYAPDEVSRRVQEIEKITFGDI